MRETPDVETSSERYARRFAGPVGRFFLDVQRRETLHLLRPWLPCSVLEVGGGHAQLASPLAEAGARVSILGSDASCAARLAHLMKNGAVRFVAGDIHIEPFPDRAFDVVLAFRVLPHVQRWQPLLSELGRVARHAVIVDYPTQRSVNAAADALFRLKKGVELDTRPFTVFAERDILSAAAAAGLRPTGRRPQFLLPMALHRALRMALVSRAVEVAAARVALTGALGSPVILRLEHAR